MLSPTLAASKRSAGYDEGCHFPGRGAFTFAFSSPHRHATPCLALPADEYRRARLSSNLLSLAWRFHPVRPVCLESNSPTGEDVYCTS
eukprot:3045249-Pleurochrysis_carterae.AAC.2